VPQVPKAFYDESAMGAGFTHNPVLAAQRRQVRRYLAAAGPSLQVLDLGCGAGTTSAVLFGDRDRFRVTGADVSTKALQQYRSTTSNPGVLLDAQHLPFPDDAFDVVVSDDVIEHLVDTDAYAREIHRVLRPGGWLFLTTPNLAAWFNRLGLLAGVQPAFSEVSFEKVFGRPGWDIVGHLRLFTHRSINEFLGHHRFEVVECVGARFDALPKRLTRLDGLLARRASIAGNTVIVARPV
jgi:SAM-dependent methyltransferase